MKGIDVAKWNGIIDWKKVKDSGVEFAVLKVIDKQRKIEDSFLMNYNGAQSQGVPTDVYNYSYATTTDKALSDAKKVISIIKGKNIEYVWLDVEDDVQKNLGMKLINIIKAYKEAIESAGFKFGVYTGLSFYNVYIMPWYSMIDCPFWIARYPSKSPMSLSENPAESKKPSIINDLRGWQYTSVGRVGGIPNNVDLSIKYDSAQERAKADMEKKTIRKGDYGVHVVYLQQRLTAKGYGVGAIDGKFGNKTLEAVKAFQAENDLAVDGIVGAKTWEVLG